MFKLNKQFEDKIYVNFNSNDKKSFIYKQNDKVKNVYIIKEGSVNVKNII